MFGEENTSFGAAPTPLRLIEWDLLEVSSEIVSVPCRVPACVGVNTTHTVQPETVGGTRLGIIAALPPTQSALFPPLPPKNDCVNSLSLNEILVI